VSRYSVKRECRKKIDADDQRVAKVRDMLAAGKSKNLIAMRIGVHKNTLYRALKRMGLQ